MTTRVITKELAVEEDLNLSKGTLTQSRGGQDLTLQGISISKVISDVSVFNNDTTANEFVDPNKYETVLVEGYSALGDEGGGIFYFDPTIAPASADSGHIFASGIITVLGAWRRFTDDKIINVKHFGAVGDGVADDTAALLLAVTAVNTRVKAVLYFPEGTYNVNVSLNMTTADFVIVRGDGIQNTIINHTGTSGPLFLFDTGAEVDEASQFLMVMDLTLRTDQVDQTAIDITSTALVTDITRSAYITRILFIGLTVADGWNFCIHSKDVRGITVKDCYARHVSSSVGTIFFNVDNTLAFVGDDYTAFNNETHFYENNFGATVPTGGISNGSITVAKLADATAGDIITFDAAGKAILLAVGASGFVLTSQGPGLPLIWAVAGAIGVLGVEGTPIASAATVDIGAADSDFVDITGTVTITSFGTTITRNHMWLQFNDVLTLTNNATSLILPTGANIITAAGDILEARRLSSGSGDWIVTSYSREDGTTIGTGVISPVFTSPEQSIVSAGALTIAHGLSFTPKLIQIYLICKTAEDNYSVGDEFPVSGWQILSTVNDQRGVVIVPNATNLVGRYASVPSVFTVLDFNTGVRANITTANWRIVIRVYG